MLIAILGVIVLIVGIVMKRSPEPGSHFSGIVTTVGAVVLLLGVALSSFKSIDAGEVGVQTLFGKVQDNVLESGLHVINPLVEVTKLYHERES
jgi:regulator of protease activity HflC (stomatin/prohibitin superfamily)